MFHDAIRERTFYYRFIEKTLKPSVYSSSILLLVCSLSTA